MPLPRAKLTKLILAELAAVPVGAQDAQGTAILKRKDGKQPTSVNKRSALTTAEQGHTHVLYGIDDSMAGTTSYESTYVEGQPREHYTGHSHPWVRNEDGSITLGEAMGHSHEVDTVSASLVEESTETEAETEKSRARSASKSTRSHEMPQAASITTEKSTMPTEQDKQIADLTKRNERLERIAKLSGAHKAHFDTLTGEDADAFLAKSAADREAAVQKALEDDKPVWTGEVTKVAVRKRDGELALQLAKQNEANAVALAKREAEIEKAEVRKLAADVVGWMPGDDETHDYHIACLRKGGDSAMTEKVIASLKGAKSTSSLGKAAPGFGGTDPQPVNKASAFAALEKGLTEFAKAKNIPNVWTEGLAAFQQTPEGKALADAYNATLA